jgi:hypothetical protein
MQEKMAAERPEVVSIHNIYIYIYVYIHTYIHTYISKCILTYIHICMYTYAGKDGGGEARSSSQQERRP